MKKKVLILLSFMLFLLSPNLTSADCADLSNFTRWFREDKHTIVFYMGNIPFASLNNPCGGSVCHQQISHHILRLCLGRHYQTHYRYNG